MSYCARCARGAFHVGRARMLAAALMEITEAQSLLPTRQANTLRTSLHVLIAETDLALEMLAPGVRRASR
jgi:hypothetical protein